MLHHPTLLSMIVDLFAVLCIISASHSFVLLPGVGRGTRMSTTSTASALDSITPFASSSSSGTNQGIGAPGNSRISIRNEGEGYDLNGILAVKCQDSKTLWVLCHGLCSSCDGTVPRFVSEKLEANTFRQAIVPMRIIAAAGTACSTVCYSWCSVCGYRVL